MLVGQTTTKMLLSADTWHPSCSLWLILCIFHTFFSKKNKQRHSVLSLLLSTSRGCCLLTSWATFQDSCCQEQEREMLSGSSFRFLLSFLFPKRDYRPLAMSGRTALAPEPTRLLRRCEEDYLLRLFLAFYICAVSIPPDVKRLVLA